jgi:hypothetical protein
MSSQQFKLGQEKMSAYALPGFFPPLENSFTFLNKSFPIDDISSSTKEEKNEYEPLARHASVAVKDAKIDPVRLIQSLAAKKCTASSKRKLSRCHHIGRRQINPVDVALHSPHEAAMTFELSIYLEGRQYTVFRSLSRIRQLQRNLVKEVECMGSDPCPSGDCAGVPEVPRLQDECKSLGFKLLQDVIRCFSPALEGWFLKILARFPAPEHSPSLSDFFYEPQPNLFWENVLLRVRKATPAKLDSIEESEHDEEEKEE